MATRCGAHLTRVFSGGLRIRCRLDGKGWVDNTPQHTDDQAEVDTVTVRAVIVSRSIDLAVFGHHRDSLDPGTASIGAEERNPATRPAPIRTPQCPTGTTHSAAKPRATVTARATTATGTAAFMP
jgi:hypothetical protein